MGRITAAVALAAAAAMVIVVETAPNNYPTLSDSWWGHVMPNPRTGRRSRPSCCVRSAVWNLSSDHVSPSCPGRTVSVVRERLRPLCVEHHHVASSRPCERRERRLTPPRVSFADAGPGDLPAESRLWTHCSLARRQHRVPLGGRHRRGRPHWSGLMLAGWFTVRQIWREARAGRFGAAFVTTLGFLLLTGFLLWAGSQIAP